MLLNKETPPFSLVARKVGDLKTIYRPQKFEELAGTVSITQLRKLVDNSGASRVFLFEGATGSGKTTCARIVAKANVCLTAELKDKPCLQCKHCIDFEKNFDVTEINVADRRKIDDMRALIQDMAYRPQYLGKKIYILDEVQQLTPDAQQVLLKHLEEPQSYILIFLCTTNKQGLEQTLIDRALTITFHALDPRDAAYMIQQVLRDAGQTPASPELVESLYQNSHGSARALLNNIQLHLEGGYDPQQQADEAVAGVKELAKALGTKEWATTALLLRKSDIRSDPEKIRMGLESYFRACLLNGDRSELDAKAKKFGPILNILTATQGVEPFNRLVVKCYQIWALVNTDYWKK